MGRGVEGQQPAAARELWRAAKHRHLEKSSYDRQKPGPVSTPPASRSRFATGAAALPPGAARRSSGGGGFGCFGYSISALAARFVVRRAALSSAPPSPD